MGVDAAQVLVERGAADLLLDDGVAAVDVAAHLVLELLVVLPGVVVAARGVDEDPAVGLAIAVAVGEQLEQGLAFDLRDGVPDGHVDGADRHRTLAVAAGLLVREHRVPHLVRIEVPARGVDQRVGGGFQQARDEAFAHQRALAVAAVGIEAVADDGLAVADHIGDHRDEAQRHLAKVDVRVADRAGDGDGLLSNLDDLHGGSPACWGRPDDRRRRARGPMPFV